MYRTASAYTAGNDGGHAEADALSVFSDILQYHSSFALSDDDGSLPKIDYSWEEGRSHLSTPAAPPIVVPFRTRGRTQTEETTLAQYSKRFFSRTLSGLKASGQSLSKMIVASPSTILIAGGAAGNRKKTIPAYTMTEENPFETTTTTMNDNSMEEEYHHQHHHQKQQPPDNDDKSVGSTSSSTVSSISLDSARRFRVADEQTPHGANAIADAARLAFEQEHRVPPSEIMVPSFSSLPPRPITTTAGEATVPKDDSWHSAWVAQGGSGGATKPELPPLCRPTPRLRTAPRSTTSRGKPDSPQRSPSCATTLELQQQQHRLERPPLIQTPSKSYGCPASPSLSRNHTDTTVTSLTTRTPPTRKSVRRSGTATTSTVHTTSSTSHEALLVGRPRRVVPITTPTVFSFGSRVGESSVITASSPNALALPPATTTTTPPPSTSHLHHHHARKSSTVSEPLWKQVLPVVRRPPPAQLCRSRTGCMA